MKLHNLTFLIATAAMLALQPMAAEKSAAAGSLSTIEKVRSDLVSLDSLVLATSDALQRVKDSAKNPGELKKALSNFDDQYSALEAKSENIRTAVVNMKARTKEYHEKWLKELENMQNPKLKEKATSRFTEVKEEFDKIMENGDEAKRAFVPYVADLKDVKTYLSADSTPDAVNSLSNTIWKLGNRSRSVSGGIRNVIEQIDRTLEKAPSK
jgi:chromosome segregation ATPase